MLNPKKKLNIALFAYNFPHRKTVDFLDQIYMHGYSISLILAALQIAFDFSPKTKNLHKSSFELIFVAGLLGLVTSFVGIGGGILMVPYFLYKGLDPHKAIGTSSLMGFALAVSGALGALLFAPIASKDIEFFVGSAFVPAVIITGLSRLVLSKDSDPAVPSGFFSIKY